MSRSIKTADLENKATRSVWPCGIVLLVWGKPEKPTEVWSASSDDGSSSIEPTSIVEDFCE